MSADEDRDARHRAAEERARASDERMDLQQQLVEHGRVIRQLQVENRGLRQRLDTIEQHLDGRAQEQSKLDRIIALLEGGHTQAAMLLLSGGAVVAMLDQLF